MYLLFDFSAAFDIVDNAIFSRCWVAEVGIRGFGMDWFKSFLRDHTCRAAVGEWISSV